MPDAPLYPDTAPLRQTVLPVAGGHRLQVAEFGTPEGIPALVLHGGPGSGCTPLLRRYFDPSRFRIVCPDQRGAGASVPAGAITDNTTPDLLDDLRALRATLGIDRWLVVGGSWGAALALAYAAGEPAAISGLLLRSSFLARREDVDAFFDGAPADLRAGWPALPEAAPDAARALTHRWWRWERQRAGLPPGPDLAGAALESRHHVYRIQAHYLRNDCWLAAPPLLDRLGALPRVPVHLVHGTADQVCRPEGARELQARIPGSTLHWVEGAGHDAAHPGIAGAMVEALDTFARSGCFEGVAA